VSILSSASSSAEGKPRIPHPSSLRQALRRKVNPAGHIRHLSDNNLGGRQRRIIHLKKREKRFAFYNVAAKSQLSKN
jgi:hypothetical protein